MLAKVKGVVYSEGGIIGVASSFTITLVEQNVKEYNQKIDMRSNLAFLERGQELINLAFKGGIAINCAKITFTEEGMFEFSIQGVLFKKTSSLKVISEYLSDLLEV